MGKRMINRFLTLVIIIALGAAAFMAYGLVRREMDYKKGREGLKEIYAVMEEAAAGGSLSDSPEDPEAAAKKRLAQYRALHEKNGDMAGWVRIEGTKVDYPVMHTPDDPEFYIHRNFNKENNSYGMIFLDGACRLGGEDRPEETAVSQNLILYGHHMRDGSMFAGIEDYDSKAFWESHRIIEFDTLEEMGSYEVVAAFKRPAGELDEAFHAMLLAETEEDYGKLSAYIRQYRFYDTGLAWSWPERLITLATCEYTEGDGRFFVVARQVPEEESGAP